MNAETQKLIETLKVIENMVNAPHWTTERKYKIRDLAHTAWVNYIDSQAEYHEPVAKIIGSKLQ